MGQLQHVARLLAFTWLLFPLFGAHNAPCGSKTEPCGKLIRTYPRQGQVTSSSRLNSSAIFRDCSVLQEAMRLFSPTIPTRYADRYSALRGRALCILNAYVGFTDRVRVHAYSYVIQAVHNFTSSPIIIVLIDCREPEDWFAFPRLIVVHVPVRPKNIWFGKLLAALVAPTRLGAIVESDSVVTHYADELFAILARYRGPHPLLTEHPDPRPPSCGSLRGCNAYYVPMSLRSTPYLHAHMAWSPRSLEFIRDLYVHCNLKLKTPFQGRSVSIDCSSDESALNTALWSFRYSSYLCQYDPYHASVLVKAWSAGGVDVSKLGVSARSSAFYIIHGAKTAQDLAVSLRLVAGAPRSRAYFNTSHYLSSAIEPCVRTIDSDLLCRSPCAQFSTNESV